MKAYQLTITGREELTTGLRKETMRILEKYPAAADDVKLFAHCCAKERIARFAQLPEDFQYEIATFAHDFDGMNRERRKINESIPR